MDVAGSVRLRKLLLAPLRTGGTTLPPVVVLMAKLLAAALVLAGYWRIPPRHLPFLPVLDRVDADLFRYALAGAFLLAACSLTAHRAVRLSCLVMGGALVLATLGSRPTFASSRLYPGCMLFLAGLSDRGTGPLGGGGAVRLQVTLLYFGAGLNKLLDPDWLDGRYFEAWMDGPHGSPAYGRMAALLPPLWLSTLMGWLTIAVELVMTVAFLRPALWAVGIACGVAFHGAAFLVLHETFGAFLYAVLLSFLVFLPWPERVEVSARAGSWGERLAKALRGLDPDGRYRLAGSAARDAGGLTVETGDHRHRGFAALQALLLYHPATLWAVTLGMGLPRGELQRLREAVFVLFLLLATPPLGRALGRLRRSGRSGRPAGGFSGRRSPLPEPDPGGSLPSRTPASAPSPFPPTGSGSRGSTRPPPAA